MRLKQKCKHPVKPDPTTCEGRLTVRWPFWVEDGSATIRFIGDDGREHRQTITPGRVIIEVPVEIRR